MNYRYDSKYNSQKKQNIQECVEYILEQEYGSVLSSEELAKILGYNISEEIEWLKYKSTISRVREFCLQYGYVLKSISGIGYYILKPEQIANHCYRKYIQKASRIYDKSAYVLDRTDKTNMNKDRLEEINELMELNKKLIDMADQVCKESKYYSRKDYYDSLEE